MSSLAQKLFTCPPSHVGQELERKEELQLKVTATCLTRWGSLVWNWRHSTHALPAESCARTHTHTEAQRHNIFPLQCLPTECSCQENPVAEKNTAGMLQNRPKVVTKQPKHVGAILFTDPEGQIHVRILQNMISSPFYGAWEPECKIEILLCMWSFGPLFYEP